MKLPIEKWIFEKGYGIDINKLFQESVICYKNGAYRKFRKYSNYIYL